MSNDFLLALQKNGLMSDEWQDVQLYLEIKNAQVNCIFSADSEPDSNPKCKHIAFIMAL